jgi:hypothetical protein
MKFFLPLLIVFVALFALRCDDDDDWVLFDTTEAGIVGNWEGTSDEDEVDFLYTIESNHNYTFIATSDDAIVEQQSGTWELNDSEITFTPEYCMSVEDGDDDESGELSDVECDDAYSITVPDGSTWDLTAGSYDEVEFTKR